VYATKHIDWLSITFASNTNVQGILPQFDFHYTGRGRYGYKYAYRDQVTGAYYQESGPNDDMGIHLTLSGEALASIRSANNGIDEKLVQALAARHGFASRIDLTLNIHEGKVTVQDVYSATKKGTLRARTTTYRYIEGKKGDVLGDTLYLGSPKSDRQLRCYNKAAEMGIVDGTAWIRLELELRNIRANGAFQSCVSNGVPATVSGHVADFMAWPNREFESALAGPTSPPYVLVRKRSSRQRWLLGQVAQALAKEQREDVSFRAQFDLAVQEAFDLLD
jgi:hypothetical protein